MRRSAGLLELLDRQIVDAQDLHPTVDQKSGGGFCNANVIIVKLWRSPQFRVVSLEEKANILTQIERRQVIRRDILPGCQFDDTSSTAHHLECQMIGARAVVEVVSRGIDVGACMRA